MIPTSLTESVRAARYQVDPYAVAEAILARLAVPALGPGSGPEHVLMADEPLRTAERHP